MKREVRQIIEEIKSRPPAKTIEEKRAAFAYLCSFSGPPVACEVRHEHFRARDGASIDVRVYGKDSSTCLMWYHGGGYVCGSLETHHAAMTQLAGVTDAQIINVGYRLAPEFQYPTALHDGLDALGYVRTKPGIKTIYVGGDSAGGNLAAALCLADRADRADRVNRQSSEIAGQILCYPTLDAMFRAKSWDDVPVKEISNKNDSREFDRIYATTEADFTDPLFSPVFAKDLADLPPATILLGECDPAKGDGQMYAEQLRAAGTPVQLKVFDGMIHGFLTMASHLEGSRDLHRKIAFALKN